MRLITPDSLHYPITVTKLRCKQSDDVSVTAPLFDYEYKTKVIEGTLDDKEGKLVEKTFPSTFQNYVEGNLSKWYIQPGMVVTRPRTPIAEIEEPCRHEVQFGGMCANCGKDMTTVDYTTVTRDTDRATVNTVHGHTALLISQAEASKSDEEAKRRLLSSRKLSLVVDLDQTIIHATVDPTVSEWQNDPANPNHDAVKDVRAFQLIDDSPGARGCWYYIKLRPGLQEFLDQISKTYELHIYTMGTRAYAQNIAKIVDPSRRIFGDRILSRDESGSMTVKNLKRLFPVDTKMVVIIDDRGDVWHWSQNLVKVTPYDFFVGIGDINSSFLPKRPGIDDVPKVDSTTAKSDEHKSNGSKPVRSTSTESVEPQSNGDVSAIEQLMSMGGANDANTLQEQASEQDEALAAQLADRPLLQKQKMLDAADSNGTPETTSDVDNQTGPGSTPPHERHNLLQDSDRELSYLQRSLQTVHQKFFDEYDHRLKGSQGGRISELRPGPSKKRSLDDLDILPDVTTIMASMKTSVLRGTSLVFSGVVPLGIDIQAHDLAVWAKSFGATVTENITKRTTHVIASPQRRTAKVRQAAKRPERISIVTQQWLFDCLSQWRKVPEAPYKIHAENHMSQRDGNGSPIIFDQQDVMLSSSEDELAAGLTDGEESDAGRAKGLTIRTNLGGEDADDTETEAELKKLMPSMSREDSSPGEETKEDWAEVNDELAEFLGSDADDDEDEEDIEALLEDGASASEAESVSEKKKKRKRKRADGLVTDGEEASDGESKTRARKRKALGRTASLLSQTEGVAASDKADGDADVLKEDSDVDEEGDDLEAELAAEMARLEEEEQAAE